MEAVFRRRTKRRIWLGRDGIEKGGVVKKDPCRCCRETALGPLPSKPSVSDQWRRVYDWAVLFAFFAFLLRVFLLLLEWVSE